MYEWSEQVKLHPWVGSGYKDSTRKILLLGDSHYEYEGEPYSEYTQDIIKYWCFERKQPGRFFTGIIWVLFGNSENLEDKFSKVAFYNYVQKLMPASRIRPSKADYEAAQKPFIEVVEKLSPDLILTFGNDMTWHFPCISKESDWKKDAADESHVVLINTFKIGDRSIPVYSLPHPSGNKFNMRVYFQYFLEHDMNFK